MNIIDNMLKNLFSGFLKRRRTNRHFKRQQLLESARKGHSSSDVQAASARVSRNMRRIASDDVAAAIIRLSSHEDGLTQAEADDRRDRFGPNEVAHEKPLPWWLHLWHCYKNPFNLLLTVLAGISFMTDDPTATAVIGTMVVLSTLIRYVQEGRSNRAAERLKAMVGNTASISFSSRICSILSGVSGSR